jgi:SAM-dependent methyltransferase
MTPRFDAQAAARLEKTYAAPEIAAQRARTRAALAARPGERGLDVGCGPGLLAAEVAREVGPAGRVAAVDASADMIAAAGARVAREGLGDRVALAVGDAGRLPFRAGAFDFVTGVQVYLYVPDVEEALAEVARVLRPGGRAVVVDTDWDSCVWRTADRARHRRVMEARLGEFAHPHLPPRLPGLLAKAGLALARVEVIPIVNLRHEPGAFSVELIGLTRRAAVEHGIPAVEADAWAADLRGRTGDGEYFFSVSRFLFLAAKG